MLNKSKRWLKTSVLILIVTISISFFSGSTYTYQNEFNSVDSIVVLKPENYYQTENQLITSIISRYHFRDFEINDSLSELIFERYIEALDHSKNYFLQSDIEFFNKQKFQLDDKLLNGDIQFYYDVFNLYLKRLNERIDFVDNLLTADFDYSINENYEFNRDKSDWAKDESELDELWRKRLKNDALTYKLNGKDWPFIQKTLKKRYKNFAQFLNQYNSEDVFQLAMNSFTQAIDPHTNYLSPVTSDNFKIDMSLSLEGIGARLQTEDDYTKVAEIIPGGPADKSGLLRADDKIVAVAQGEDGEFEDIIGWRITEVVKIIRGTKGTLVRLLILKAGSELNSKPIEISLLREKVKLEDQAAKGNVLEILNEDKPFRIGVIDIPKFYNDFEGQRNGDGNYKSTTKDVKKIIDSLKTENVDGIIIDLREDGGGSLQEAIELTGLFIKDGPVVQVKSSNNLVEVDRDPDTSIVYNGPLAVMINRFSASASEIFSAAIQDYGRGVIIGSNSYGKGTVQNMLDLNKSIPIANKKLGQLKLTIAKFYRIDGSTTQRLGVVPDISLPSLYSAEEFGEDAQKSALPWDKIQPTPYKKFYDLSNIIPLLEKKHKERAGEDIEYQLLVDEVKEFNDGREKKTLSLNEEVRKKERDEADARKKKREEEKAKALGIKIEDKKEVNPQTTKLDDYELKESGRILANLILAKVG